MIQVAPKSDSELVGRATSTVNSNELRRAVSPNDARGRRNFVASDRLSDWKRVPCSYALHDMNQVR